MRWLLWLWGTGSRASRVQQIQGFSCSMTCEIFGDQEWNPCPLRCVVNFLIHCTRKEKEKVTWLYLTLCDSMSVESSKQEYWSGWPFPPPGKIFLTQGSNPGLLHCTWIFFPAEPPGKPAVPRGNSIKDSKSWGSFNFQTPDGVVALSLTDAVLLVS